MDGPTSSAQTGRLGTWHSTILVFLGVVVLSIVATVIAQRLLARSAEARLALQSEALVASLEHGAGDVEVRLAALGALFGASEEVTGDEYGRFVADTGLVGGMGGMAYMPIVDEAGLEVFEELMALEVPGYQVFEIDGEGNRVPVGSRDLYFPIQYFEPSDALDRPLGLEAGSPPGRLPYLMEAVISGRTIATPTVQLATTGQDGFVVFAPIADSSGTVVGVVASPIVLADLVADQVPDGLATILDWTIRDVTEDAQGFAPRADIHFQILPSVGEGMVHSDTIQVFSRVWQIDVQPSANSPLQGERYNAHWILLVGLITGLSAGFAVYQSSRRDDTVREMKKLTEVLDAKDQFVATVSHELRTPLTSVLGFADILRDQAMGLSQDERTELATAIATEASDLSFMIEDLLTMTRADHGTLSMVALPTDLEAQTSQVLEALSQTGIPIETTRPAVTAVADSSRVRQIVRNLVTNAVAYGGPSIRVRIGAAAEMTAVEVIDNGAGVPPEDADEIFQPYYRAHPTEGMPSSVGLGLTVSQALARLMGGNLSYRRIDGETIFHLALPAVPRATNGWDPTTATHSEPARTTA